MNSYFRPAGDLNEADVSSKKNLNLGGSKFVFAGNLPEKEKTVKSKREEYEEYLLTIVSGKKSPNEFGVIRNCGSRIATWDKLKELVELNYNIIKAEYINDDLVSFEYESPVIEFDKERGR